ncbi:hypothetical protein ACVWYH_005245 [Bradyrhizobium sp. GM24.11]
MSAGRPGGFANVGRGRYATRPGSGRWVIANHLLVEKAQTRAQMLHQWDQRTCTDARQIGGVRAGSDRLGKIRRRDPNRPRPAVRQRDNDVGGTAPRSLLQHLKPVPKKKMMRVSDRDARHDPLKNRGTLTCSATPPTPTPFSTAWSITPTGSISTARACGEPVSPAERPEPVALWTCRCAWTTRRALPTCPQQEQQKTSPSSRDSRLTTRLRRCQKPDSQNASRPERHQIGRVGEIISESWARSNRYTRARSSESAD